MLLREQGVSFQRLKTWKHSNDPNFFSQEEPDPAPVWLMDGTVDVGDGDLDVVICVDEFGPLNLQPILDGSGHWPVAAARSRGGGRPTGDPMGCATCLPPTTCRGTSCMAYPSAQRRGEFLSFLRYLRRLYPPTVRIAIVLDNYSPHLFHHR